MVGRAACLQLRAPVVGRGRVSNSVLVRGRTVLVLRMVVVGLGMNMLWQCLPPRGEQDLDDQARQPALHSEGSLRDRSKEGQMARAVYCPLCAAF